MRITKTMLEAKIASLESKIQIYAKQSELQQLEIDTLQRCIKRTDHGLLQDSLVSSATALDAVAHVVTSLNNILRR